MLHSKWNAPTAVLTHGRASRLRTSNGPLGITFPLKGCMGLCFWWVPALGGSLGFNLVSVMDNAALNAPIMYTKIVLCNLHHSSHESLLDRSSLEDPSSNYLFVHHSNQLLSYHHRLIKLPMDDHIPRDLLTISASKWHGTIWQCSDCNKWDIWTSDQTNQRNTISLKPALAKQGSRKRTSKVATIITATPDKDTPRNERKNKKLHPHNRKMPEVLLDHQDASDKEEWPA